MTNGDTKSKYPLLDLQAILYSRRCVKSGLKSSETLQLAAVDTELVQRYNVT